MNFIAEGMENSVQIVRNVIGNMSKIVIRAEKILFLIIKERKNVLNAENQDIMCLIFIIETPMKKTKQLQD